MVISIHQPDYIPYIGYFYKIFKADKFIYLDDCQFSNNNMHHWNRIKTPQGECRLKIPVEQHLGDALNTVRTKDELKWKEKHLKTIEMNYKRAPHFADVFYDFGQLLLMPYTNLAAQNIAINTWIIKKFGIQTELYQSSELCIYTHKEERVIDICEKIGGDIYLSGNGARAYQSEENFTKHGIRLQYTDFRGLEYPQLWRDFLPNMSVLDFILNCGFDWNYVLEAIEQY